MSYQNLKFTLSKTEQLEDLSEMLSEAGAISITFEDAGDDPVFEPLPDEVILWKDTMISALFPQEIELRPVIERLQETENFQSYTLEAVAEKNWQNLWTQNWEPLCFYNRALSQTVANKLWICPSFCDEKNLCGTIVRLDPGLAFGTGTHPTTALCLDWLTTSSLENQQVIDYGCGSGILAIAALKLGAKKAYAIDHDPQALQATQSNAELNEIESTRLMTSLPDQMIGKIINADILLANILANPLIQLAEYFATCLKPNGYIVLSGILLDQVTSIQRAYADYFYNMTMVEKKGWVMICGMKI